MAGTKCKFGVAARLSKDRRGAIAFEFALVVPVMLTMLFGVTQFGIALYNKEALTNATRAAVRMLALGRTSGTVWSDTRNAFFQAVPNLTPANTTITISINGIDCGSDGACVAVMVAGSGLPASVRATYPCNLKVIADFAPGCQLTSMTTQKVE